MAGLFLIAARVHKARQLKKEEAESHLPRLAQNEFWEGGKTGDHFGKKSEFEVGEVKPITQLFRLPLKKVEPSQPVRVQEPTKQLENSFIPPPPMIAFQRSVSPAEAPEEPEDEPFADEPEISLEPGRLLYCQLLSPVSSGQGNAPVLGQLTRSYVVKGRVILPRGTTVTGQLQGTNGERLNFNSQWVATLPSGRRIDFSAQLQEAAYDAVTRSYLPEDGLAGLPGQAVENEEQKTKLGKVASVIVGAASELAKERVETEVGNFVPASGRNTTIDSSSALLEEILGSDEAKGQSNQNLMTIPAGASFHLEIMRKGYLVPAV
ncbi:TrbI/VirB10 family protein [Roseibacillus persicicus]|uniref:TrbI/VirB10 family protein n=1 Tax=Roseibacillus persicicus TaxID=454148 RepID=UPI00398AA182